MSELRGSIGGVGDDAIVFAGINGREIFQQNGGAVGILNSFARLYTMHS